MKKILFLAMAITVVVACSSDNSFRLTEDIGSIPIDLIDTVNYSYFLPGTGTLEFRQSFERSTKPSKVTTELKIVDNSGIGKEQPLELLVFENTKFSNSNLDFIEDFTLVINDTITPFKEISTNGKVLIDSTNNFYVALFDETALTGKYGGEAKILQEQPVDANGDPQPDQVEGLFNVYGNVNTDNHLFLLVKEEDALFRSISGTFSIDDKLFFGEAIKGNDSITLSPQDAEGVLFKLPDSTLMETNTSLNYNLLFINDNAEKKLQINLTKTN